MRTPLAETARDGRNPSFAPPPPAPEGAAQQDAVEAHFDLAKALLRRAARAREDVGEFLALVMRDEETHKPVKLAPHQKVLLAFMSDHRRGVIMLPRGASKTFCLATFILWRMGKDPSYKAAVVSSTQDQAEKVLKIIRETIETNAMLRMVFPHLCRSPNKFDSWTQTKITIARPSGTKDPTLVVYGAYGAIRGSRLKDVFIDDVLTEENVNTDESRKKLIQWVDASVLQTLDTKGDSKAFLIGTPLHPEDILHVAKKRGWAMLKMDVVGNVQVEDDVERWNRVGATPYWDHEELRLGKAPFLRLKAHDPDPRDEENLFPLRWGSERTAKREGRKGYVDTKRDELTPWVFQTEHMLIAQDYATAMCRPEWILACKREARVRGYALPLPVRKEPNGNLRFMGVDLAIKVKEHHDLTAYFTFEVLPSGHRLILDVEIGRWDLVAKIEKVKQKYDAFRPDLILIEDNSAQHLFIEALAKEDIGLPVRGSTTGANKAHPEQGLPGLFNEIFRGAWLIPCDEHDKSTKDVEAACDAAVNYVPDLHTKDVMMAWWLAYQCTRKWGIGLGPMEQGDGNVAASIMSR